MTVFGRSRLVGRDDGNLGARMTSSINLSSPRAFERGSPEKVIRAESDCLGDPGSWAGMTEIFLAVMTE